MPRIPSTPIPLKLLLHLIHNILPTFLLHLCLLHLLLIHQRLQLWPRLYVELSLSDTSKLLLDVIPEALKAIACGRAPGRCEEVAEVASAAFAEAVRVVGGRGVEGGYWGADVGVADFVGLGGISVRRVGERTCVPLCGGRRLIRWSRSR